MPSGPLICIIDDDESCRDSLVGLLRSADFAVVAFPSAEDFLVSDALCKVDCLILDVRMPGMGGVGLQLELAGHGHDIPIIFISAEPDGEVRSRVCENGAVDFLVKPFEEGAVLNAVRAASRTMIQ